MSALRYSVPLRNARADALTAFVAGSAILKIFAGTQPATGGAETTLLAQLTCNATFAPAAVNGVLTLNGITAASSAAERDRYLVPDLQVQRHDALSRR